MRVVGEWIEAKYTLLREPRAPRGHTYKGILLQVYTLQTSPPNAPREDYIIV